ncbi:hypothetical protein EDB86DRAFT_2825577 [Lactarius hatsudake]|nr:hypothetical protein EDB86DRAFT_2825577 [Lactarius hatsudake]
MTEVLQDPLASQSVVAASLDVVVVIVAAVVVALFVTIAALINSLRNVQRTNSQIPVFLKGTDCTGLEELLFNPTDRIGVRTSVHRHANRRNWFRQNDLFASPAGMGLVGHIVFRVTYRASVNPGTLERNSRTHGQQEMHAHDAPRRNKDGVSEFYSRWNEYFKR